MKEKSNNFNTLDSSAETSVYFGLYQTIEKEVLKMTVVSSQTLSGSLIRDCHYKQVVFTDCIFDCCEFIATKFHDCIFENCTFQYSNMAECHFENCSFSDCKNESSFFRKKVLCDLAIKTKPLNEIIMKKICNPQEKNDDKGLSITYLLAS